MSDLLSKLANLPPKKRELIMKKLREKQGLTIKADKVEDSGTFPLSSAQRRLWFLDQLERKRGPANVAYNIPQALKLVGSLKVGILERALAEVCGRHRSLRVTFGMEGDSPVQIVTQLESNTIPRIDLSALPPEIAEKTAQALAVRDATTPFNLQKGPLLRLHLIRLEEKSHVLLLNMHHVISDGWSMSVLIGELTTLYGLWSVSSEAESPLPPLSIQYSDFARWQEEWLAGEGFKSQLAWWRENLSGAPTFLPLPTDFPRPHMQTYVGDRHLFEIEASVAAQLRALGKQHDATMFMTLSAVFGLLLGRYAHASDLILGSPIAGRNRPELEPLIGFFANMMAMRIDMSGEPTFNQLLIRVRDFSRGAYANQDVPFDKLVEGLDPQRDMSHTPLFQQVLVVQNTSDGGTRRNLPGLKLEPIRAENRAAKFDLTLTVNETGSTMPASFEFNTDLFAPGTVSGMAHHFCVLLKALVANPDIPISRISLLDSEQRTRLVQSWQDAQDFGGDDCLHLLFSRRAAQAPDNLAVTCPGQESYTYGRLEAESRRLAHYLRSKGVTSDDLVGICLERSTEMVVGILGILKAGAAYVPLDPSVPPERMAYILEDAGAKLLVTSESLSEKVAESNAAAICLDRDRASIDSMSSEALDLLLTPDNLAYVIYTSGTTGQPKGVLNTHRNVCRLFQATHHWFHFSEEDVWTLFHSYAFDFSVWELWGPLLYGGRLVVVPYFVARSPEEFHQLLVQESVTVLNQTPSAFRQLVAYEEQENRQDLNSLRFVVFGGEALEFNALRPWFKRHGDQQPVLINMYGITETTVHVTWREVRMKDVEAGLGSAIGVAIPDLSLCLLDGAMEPQAIGIAGELHVGGPGLARGYHKRPSLTAQRFVPHPFSKIPGGRLYKSGDLARMSGDELLYGGRIDHQVKIRGFRIETGEIEARLAAHEQVRDAIVLVGTDLRGEACLIAWYTGEEMEAPVLRRFMAETLPEYMVPSAFVHLITLPLTANGKLDRRALPAPQWGATTEVVAARSDREAMILEIYRAILDVTRIGIHDSFFEVGGHSLLATRAMSRIRQACQIDLPLALIFEYPTVAELAEQIDRIGGETREGSAPPLIRQTRGSQIPLSFAQQRLWFLDQLEPDSPLYNIPAAMRLRGPLNVAGLEKALNAVIQRHESLRTTFSQVDGKPIQLIKSQLTLPLPLVELSPESPLEQAPDYVMKDAIKPFNLKHGPLIRVTLLKIGPDDHGLLVNMHHIISDGWSMGVFVREIMTFYKANLEGMDLETLFPPLPIQYADFAIWQRNWMESGALAQQLDYWKKALAGSPSVLELPADRPRPGIQTYNGASVELEIGENLTSSLMDLSSRNNVTLFMTLQAAYALLLSHYCNTQDLNIGTPVANRNHQETESLIGFFVNTLVLRMDLTGPQTRFTELLARTRKTALDAYQHQDAPFEQVVDVLGIERSLSHSPLFQVFFALQNTPTEQKDSLPAGLSIEALGREATSVKFDMTLNLTETGSTIVGAFQYNADLFDAVSIRAMSARFLFLLEQVTENPNQPLSDYRWVLEQERQPILQGWNLTTREFPRACVHHLFEERVARHPEKTALLFDMAQELQIMTYDQLNRTANQLAHHLLDLGVGPEDRVAMCMDRSPKALATMIGILKTGACFVPLDPDYPLERLTFMLEDTSAGVLITDRDRRHELPPFDKIILNLNELHLTTSEANPPGAGYYQSPIYVMYTSGSTGKPKGVQTIHEGVVRLVIETNYCELEDSRWLMIAPISFDASTLEIWGPLLNSGSAGIVPSGPFSLEDLSLAIQTYQVTHAHFTPRLFQQMIDFQAASLGKIKHIFSGGEAASQAHFRRLLESNPTLQLTNAYGPTETTTYASCFSARPWLKSQLALPIGPPISNTTLYVLDTAGHLTAPGVPGELYIGGPGLARGYLNRPALTAEKFVVHPFGGQKGCIDPAGSRLYRTGDRVRWVLPRNWDLERVSEMDPAVIEFIGRVDFQVKIRGFRIEPGEIEVVLQQHPLISDALVLVRNDLTGVPGELALAAYVQTEKEIGDLREWVSNRLPAYMVPNVFLSVPNFPLTAVGKVDRKVLGQMSVERGTRGEYVAPRNHREEEMARLWSDLLHVPSVGIHDNFFESGGHSLLATQLVSRIRTTFAVELPIRMLFEAPTIAGLCDRLDSLSGSVVAPPLVPTDLEAFADGIPVSYAQQRLWFLDQLEPGSPMYNIPGAIRLVGDLNRQALQRALTMVVARHHSLRTTFRENNGDPVQIVAPASDQPLPFTDLTHLTESQRHQKVSELVNQDAMAPFNLATGPLLRVSLFQLAEKEHLLCYNMHHIISDGWSMGIFIRDLVACYQAVLSDSPPQLPELPVQYPDYSVSQRNWLEAGALEQQLDYWQEQLAGAPALLELPLDHARPAMQSFNGANLRFVIPATTGEALNRLSSHNNATLFMTLQAAFATLLARYSGQDDICLGTPVANRNCSETENLIGFFVNTLVLRLRPDLSENFQMIQDQARRVSLEAFQHQDTPFEKVVDRLHPQRSLGYSPLFQVFFVLQNLPEEKQEQTELALHPVEAELTTSKFDLSLTHMEDGQEIHTNLTYNTDLFEASTMGRMASHYQNLLSALLANPEAPLFSLELMSEQEKRTILDGWNQTARKNEFLTVSQLFHNQNEITPSRVALQTGTEELTYAELAIRANNLAQHLHRLGISTETAVAIFLERGTWLPSALLGVMASGAYYVPLDPIYPPDRLAHILEDAEPALIITSSTLLASLPDHQARVLLVEEIQTGTTSKVQLSQVDATAYTIYTSGSTGKPKGVQISHKALTNFLWTMAIKPGISQDDVLLAVTTISFDIAGLELFLPLISGARIILAGRETAMDAISLMHLIYKTRPTIFQATPATWQMLLDSGWTGDPNLKILCGGEAFPAELARRLRSLSGSVWNMYGPTETTIWSTIREIGIEELGNAPVPIGQPVANTRTYILDPWLLPVPAGAAGELFIAGEGVARGYLNKPGLTAERFLPDPFTRQAGARMYRTGDLVRARVNATGDLETLVYLGRTDFQVKIRGFRIEPGEIEAILTHHQSVRQAVVHATGTGASTRLVGYIIAEEEDAELTGKLRNWLSERLPAYMVPTAWVMLDHFPLTLNRKVDRRRLPEPETSTIAMTWVAPRSPIEEALAGIWAEVLELERVSVEADFFELGGHSLLATRVISRIRQQLGTEIPIRFLFETPTIAGLATRMATHRGLVSAPPLLPLDPKQYPLGIPLSFTQQRLWFLDQLEPGSPIYNMPGAFRLKGRLEHTILTSAYNQVIARHQSLRTLFSDYQGQPTQRILQELILEIPITDLTGHDSEKQATMTRKRVEQDAVTPFDLAKGPLIRLFLVRLAEEEHVLSYNMHHIISDGWSMGLFIRDLITCYRAIALGRDCPLAPLPIQYADYAVWQRNWLEAGALKQQLAYWKEQLHGAPALLELPIDRPRPPVQTFSGEVMRFSLPASVNQALHQLANAEGATLFMTLQAAFSVLLARYSGQQDICLGTPVANRNRTETEDLIGFFANTLVMRIKQDNEDSFKDLIARSRTTALEAYQYQDTPFEQVVETLQPQRSLSYSPLFQVFFVLQNLPGEKDDLSGLTLKPFESTNTTARFDLALTHMESGQELITAITYNTDLFDAATIQRMAQHYKHLLGSIIAAPHARLHQLQLMPDVEVRRILEGWNQTGRAYSKLPVQHRFQEVVQRTPDRIALQTGEQTLSYEEMYGHVLALTLKLRSLGVGPETAVAIFPERNFQLPVALMAVLMAGGYYVPLDPIYPADRLAHILEDAAPRVIITTTELRNLLPDQQIELVILDQSEPVSAMPFQPSGDSQNTAYTIYTSGSTGKPKGVCISHGMLSNFLESMALQPGLTEADSLLSVTTISFDIAGLELYLPLISGARVILADRETSMDGRALARLMLETKPTIMQATPATWSMLLDAGWEGDAGLKILCGGEAFPAWLAARLLPLAGSVWNMYGPTETTIWSTLLRVTTAGEDKAPVPIGLPVANTQTFILDQYLNPTAPGVAGELFLSGDGVARYYHKRPALTADRFLPDPFAREPGRRMYRTGDLVRARIDAQNRLETLIYLGRTDFQVKIRGFRIEIGEIETILTQHPQVHQAVVHAWGQGSDIRLVGYLIPTEVGRDPISDLRAWLETRLPGYMIPSGWVLMDHFPLTPNLKVDRKCLPEPAPEVRTKTYVAPQTAVEKALAAIWADVLKLERVGVTDDFFALGGHSLMATRIISRIRGELGVEVPLRAIFSTPTLGALAAGLNMAGSTIRLPPITATPRNFNDHGETILPLSFAQKRLWFVDRLRGRSAVYNMPFALDLKGPLDQSALEKALNLLVERHEVLRTNFEERQGQPVQVISASHRVCLQIKDLSSFTAEEQDIEIPKLITAHAMQPFDLEKDPLLQVSLLHCSEFRHVLLLNLHHIVCDAWSLGILVNELTSGYFAFVSGKEPQLPALSVQYADFAVWQQQPAYLEGLELQLLWWKQHLKDLSYTQLPLDRDFSESTSLQAAEVRLRLSESLSSRVLALGASEAATPFMTLLAAFSILLSRHCGQKDIVVGTPIAGRTNSALEPLVGCFLETLVMRTRLDEEQPDPGFRQVLNQVRRNTLGAFSNQDLPFERLVEALQPTRDLNRHPLFDILINFMNTPQAQSTETGLQISSMASEENTARFQMTLYIVENEGRLGFRLLYRKALFSAQKMDCLLQQLSSILEQVTADPDINIEAISLLDDASRKILPDPSASLPVPYYEPVITTFLEKARTNPDHQALSWLGKSMNYGELALGAISCASALTAAGIKPGDVVAIHGTRSFGFIACMLGVMRAGGILLNLDPAHPQQRRALMLERANARMMLYLGTAPEATLLPADSIAVDPNSGHPISAPLAEPGPLPEGDDPAYIFFTSGSTGLPKAVMGNHKSLAHFMAWERETLQITADDRCSQLATQTFDVSMRDIFVPLTVGAVLCLPPAQPFQPLVWLAEEQVTLCHAVPSLVTAWLAEAPEELVLPKLKRMGFAGEPLTSTLVHRFRNRFPQTEAHNFYGPTETVLAKCHWLVPAEPVSGIQPVGIPLPQTQALVLNQANQLCGIGEIGEIVIRTPFRGCGYLAADETALQAFFVNPFTGLDQDVLYRTGDLGRYRPDGLLEVLGRRDHQVKLRGVRIELGEIDAILDAQPDVAKGAAMVREFNNEKFLIAFVVPHSSGSDPHRLRKMLAQRLPEAMVPGRIIFLEKMPLNPNGKVDRKALAQIEIDQNEVSGNRLRPQNRTQLELMRIWQEVLDRSPIGILDNFFDLGGHSLMAIRLMTAISERFGTPLPVNILFQAPTIAALSLVLDGQAPLIHRSPLIPIQPVGPGRPFFCVHPISGNAMCYTDLARLLGQDRPFYGIQSPIFYGDEPMESIEAMAAVYLQTIRQVQPEGPYLIGGWSFGGRIAVEIARELLARGEEVGLLTLFDSRSPRDPDFEEQDHSDARILADFLVELAGASTEFMDELKPELEQLEGDDALNLVLARARAKGLVPEGLGLDVVKPRLTAYKTLRRVGAAWDPEPYPGNMLFFKAGGDIASGKRDRALDWEELVLGELAAVEVEGSHQTLLNPPHVEKLAQTLLRFLEESDPVNS